LFLVCSSCNKKRSSTQSAKPLDNRTYRSTYSSQANQVSPPRYSHLYQQAPPVRTQPLLPPPRVAKPVGDRTCRSTYGTQDNTFSSPRYSHIYQQAPIARAPLLPTPPVAPSLPPPKLPRFQPTPNHSTPVPYSSPWTNLVPPLPSELPSASHLPDPQTHVVSACTSEPILKQPPVGYNRARELWVKTLLMLG
jgi:hypothetical protein